MKIDVLSSDGKSIETLNLIGTIEVTEARINSEGEIEGQGCLYLKDIGIRHFFHAKPEMEGRYDGWEAEIKIPIDEKNLPSDGSLPQEIKDFAEAFDRDRVIRPLSAPDEGKEQ